jgi:hypothetical protein
MNRFSFTPEKIFLGVLIIFCFLLLWLNRKRVAYFRAPDDVINSYSKQQAIMTNAFLGLVLALTLHIGLLEGIFHIDHHIPGYDNYRLLFIGVEFISCCLIASFIVEGYYLVNSEQFRQWKKENSKGHKHRS